MIIGLLLVEGLRITHYWGWGEGGGGKGFLGKYFFSGGGHFTLL